MFTILSTTPSSTMFNPRTDCAWLFSWLIEEIRLELISHATWYCVCHARCADWWHAHTRKTYERAAFFRKYSKRSGCQCARCPPVWLANYMAFWGINSQASSARGRSEFATRGRAVTANRNRCEIIGGNFNLGCWYREQTHRCIILFGFGCMYGIWSSEHYFVCVFFRRCLRLK